MIPSSQARTHAHEGAVTADRDLRPLPQTILNELYPIAFRKKIYAFEQPSDWVRDYYKWRMRFRIHPSTLRGMRASRIPPSQRGDSSLFAPIRSAPARIGERKVLTAVKADYKTRKILVPALTHARQRGNGGSKPYVSLTIDAFPALQPQEPVVPRLNGMG